MNSIITTNMEREPPLQLVRLIQMKKSTKIAFGLAAVAALIASTGFVALQSSEPTYVPGVVPPATSIKEITKANKISDASTIKNLVGYDVRLPAKLPDDYTVQFLGVNENIGATTILISKKPATEDTTNVDFIWMDRGIWVTIHQIKPEHTKERLLTELVPFDAQPIKVNGIDGMAHEIVTQEIEGEKSHSPAELVFYKGNKHIYMQGMVPVSDLIKIAELL